MPEGHLARLTRRGRDEHAIVRDLFDAPRRCAERERLAHLAFEHHLFIELADAHRPIRAGEEHAVQAAIGNRSGVGNGHAPGAFAPRDRVVHAVPRDARAQLRELVRGVAARQHVEHPLEHPQTEIRVRRGAAHAREQIVGVPHVHAGHRDDLLREHVEGVARIACRFDEALVHRPRHRRTGDQIAAELGKDDPFADGTRLVTGPPDALQPAGNRRRRLDLHDEIDGAHVDAELERRGGDERLDTTRFQQIFDLAARHARQRAVVRADERFAGELVQGAGQALREATAVDEDQRRAVRMNQLEQARVNRAPNRGARSRTGGRAAGNFVDLGESRHILDRDVDRQPQLLPLGGVDDRHRPVGGCLLVAGELVVQLALDFFDRLRIALPRAPGRRAWFSGGARLGAAEKSCDFIQRTLRRRESNPL